MRQGLQHDIPLVRRDPVFSDLALRLLERYLARADQRMQPILETVLRVRVPGHRVVALGPEVRRHIGAAELEADQVVDLEVPGLLIDPVSAIDLRLQLARRVAHRLCVAFEVARIAQSARPGLKVLFASGYATELTPASRLLKKPYRANQLASQVASALES